MRRYHDAPRRPRGYALILVIAFLVVLTAVLGSTFARIGATLRLQVVQGNDESRTRQAGLRAAARYIQEVLVSAPDPAAQPGGIYYVTLEGDLKPRGFEVVVRKVGEERWELSVTPYAP